MAGRSHTPRRPRLKLLYIISAQWIPFEYSGDSERSTMVKVVGAHALCVLANVCGSVLSSCYAN